MKYDILEEFHNYINEVCSKNTSKTYYSAVKKLLKDIQFKQLDEIDTGELVQNIKLLKSKNAVSAAKNGLKYLKEFDSSFQLPEDSVFKDISSRKRNRVKSKGKIVNYDTMRRKVNAGGNKKIKLACRVAAISGLRVSELAELQAKDIAFGDNKIRIFVQKGKGGKAGTIECLKDMHTYQILKEHCKKLEPEEKLFYSESYMRQKAWENDMQMHDFRRVFAVLQKKQLLSEGYTSGEANKIVQDKLRHSRFSTTKRYLYGRKIVLRKRRIKSN